MSKRTSARKAPLAAIKKAVAVLETQLVRYRHGGVGVDLPEDPSDPSRTDPIFAQAVMRLLAKYGDALVVSRFRGRAQLAWRASAFGAVQKGNREALDQVGFFDVKSADDVGGINPHGLEDPRVEAAKQLESRRKRVAEWQANGWKGVMLPNGDFYVPPEPATEETK